jgi:hypothetical protein
VDTPTGKEPIIWWDLKRWTGKNEKRKIKKERKLKKNKKVSNVDTPTGNKLVLNGIKEKRKHAERDSENRKIELA